MKRNKLRGRIVEKYGTNGQFAKEIGVSVQTVSNVVSGRSTPTGKKMPIWCAALEIRSDEVGIFFYPQTLEN